MILRLLKDVRYSIFALLLMLICLMMFLFAGCVPYRYLDKHHSEICVKCIDEYSQTFPKKDSVSTKKDTVTNPGIGLIKDFYQSMLLICDSSNKVQVRGLGMIIDSLNHDKTKDNKLGDINRLLTNYVFKNGILTVNFKLYQDSIRILNEKINTIQTQPPTIITKPPIIEEKTPFWVWLYMGFTILVIIALIVIVIKK
jgi:hypothetical protein